MEMVETAFLLSVRKLLRDSSGGILLAVSGGVDSMVMAHLFVKWLKTKEGSQMCREVVIAHMNFSLRGAESDRDQGFVMDWAHEHGMAFYTKTVSTLDYAAEHRISAEMAARDLRYDWFRSLCRTHGLFHIAVAHNANDRAETMLLNLVRGTGLRGLCSMREQNDMVIRPLLEVPRSRILEYARENNITYCVDSTNQETDFARNKIRHLVIPILEQISPNVELRMGKNARNLQQAQLLLDSVIENKRIACATPQGFSIPCLIREGHVEFWLHALLSPYGFKEAQIPGISESLLGQSGKRHLSWSHALWIDRQEIVIRPLTEPRPSVMLDYRRIERTPGFIIPKDSKIATLDADKLQFPLKIRNWEPGDRFIPLGMTGFKKISDFLVDQKIPVYEKKDIYVLCSGNDIAWVIGWRIDNRFRVTSATTTILLVHQKEAVPGSLPLPEDPEFVPE